MSNGNESAAGPTCGDELSPRPENRPGQRAVVYRAGVHASFLEEMKSWLVRQPVVLRDEGDEEDGKRTLYPLERLTTRSSDDFAVALLDAWAAVADVLTFYQERIANEGYLGTATERRSVLELARTIGYELNPGVAASTYLSFTVEDAPGAPGSAVVPKGTRVLSIPAAGKLPQPFETSEEILTRAEWNALRPRLTRPQELGLYQDPADNRVKLCLLGISAEFDEDTPGIQSVLPDSLDKVFLLNPDLSLETRRQPLQVVEIDHLYLQGTSAGVKAGDRLLLVGKSLSGSLTMVIQVAYRVTLDGPRSRTRVDLKELPKPAAPPFRPLARLRLALPRMLNLALTRERARLELRGRAWRERDLHSLLRLNRWSPREFLRTTSAPPPPELPPPDQGIFLFREKVGIFGHNAAADATLPANITRDSKGNPHGDADFFLERDVSNLVVGSWVVLEGSSEPKSLRIAILTERTLADFSLSGKATGVSVEDRAGLDKFTHRNTTVYLRSEPAVLAPLPIEDIVEQGTVELVLDGLVLGLHPGQPVALSGERSDARGVRASEVVLLKEIIHQDGYTHLLFETPLAFSYLRGSLELNTNVSRATHGETIREVLGSGDGAKVNQRFQLKKPPLTYVSASTPTGAASTLEVRVNDIRWEEARALLEQDGSSPAYQVRIEDDGSTWAVFGDGAHGSRLPTGQENIAATYRSGIGPEGEVKAGSLTLLQTRPLGIRGVTNVLAASGAAAPESSELARENAPLTVLAMGRIVSLQDYEDFARAFAGIGKAQAVALARGHRQLVHLTVATATGNPMERTSELYRNLVRALTALGDPMQEVLVAGYRPLLFHMAAKIAVDPKYIAAQVLEKVADALREEFGFARRRFGQGASAGEVLTVIQKVPGVVFADLDALHLATEPPALRQWLVAQPAQPSVPEPLAAELLLVNPVGISLMEAGT